jgi:hypothetical protein
LIEAVDEHIAGTPHGFFAINVRGGAKGGEHVEIIDDALADITVEIIAGTQQTPGTDDLADGRVAIALSVLHAFDKHGSVHGKEEAVEWEEVLDAFEELGFEALISGGGDWTAGDGCGNDGWEKWIGIALEESEARILGELRTAEDGEIFIFGANARVGAALNANAAESDALGRCGSETREGSGGGEDGIEELAAWQKHDVLGGVNFAGDAISGAGGGFLAPIEIVAIGAGKMDAAVGLDDGGPEAR